MKTFLLIVFASAFAAASAVAVGAMPARFGLFLDDVPNVCFDGTKFCDGVMECGPDDDCPDHTCTITHYTVPSTNPVEKRFYCVCNGGASSPDPANQPSWPCGMYGTTIGGTPTTLTCANGSCAPQTCGFTFGGGCLSCTCR